MSDRAAAFERFSRAVDGAMTVLALAMIPLIVVPLVYDLSPAANSAFLAVDYLVWAAFGVEYLIKLWLAPDRWRFVKANIPDLIIVVVPMLRPLRILRSVRLLRLLRLARLAAFAVEGIHEARDILRRRGLSWVLLIVAALILVAAALVLNFERDAPNGNIRSYPDALWWAVTTITTVGYGDRFPSPRPAGESRSCSWWPASPCSGPSPPRSPPTSSSSEPNRTSLAASTSSWSDSTAWRPDWRPTAMTRPGQATAVPRVFRGLSVPAAGDYESVPHRPSDGT